MKRKSIPEFRRHAERLAKSEAGEIVIQGHREAASPESIFTKHCGRTLRQLGLTLGLWIPDLPLRGNPE
jgi:hypothetical protein